MSVATRWSAGGARDRDPGATWADGLANAFVQLDVEKASDRAFFGAIDQVDAGDVKISRVTAGGHRVCRRPQHIARARGDVVFLNFQLFSVGETSQGGSTVRAAPLDVVIADTSRPFQIEHKEQFSLCCIEAPRKKVPEPLLRVGALHLSRSAFGRDLAKLLCSQIHLMLRAETSPEARATLTGQLFDILMIAAEGPQCRSASEAPHAAKAGLIEDYARLNFRNPGLNAATAALAFCVSERYVQKLFAARGTTFSEFVVSLRLNDCATALSLARKWGTGIASLAYDAGFSDLSHFNRAFKARFGETPSAFRKRLTGA